MQRKKKEREKVGVDVDYYQPQGSLTPQLVGLSNSEFCYGLISCLIWLVGDKSQSVNMSKETRNLATGEQ